MHALSLPTDIKRTGTYVVQLVLEPRISLGDGESGAAGKYFRLKDARAVSVVEAMGYGDPWPESLEIHRKQRELSESEGRGTQLAVGIECPPLTVQMVSSQACVAKKI